MIRPVIAYSRSESQPRGIRTKTNHVLDVSDLPSRYQLVTTSVMQSNARHVLLKSVRLQTSPDVTLSSLISEKSTDQLRRSMISFQNGDITGTSHICPTDGSRYIFKFLEIDHAIVEMQKHLQIVRLHAFLTSDPIMFKARTDP